MPQTKSRVTAGVAEFHIPKIDCCGNLICPGLIDVHTHGCNGFLFSSGNELEIENILGEYRKHGVTSVLATFASEKMDTFLQQADRFTKFIGAAPGFPEIIGIYYESQYIDMDQRGALNPDYVKSPIEEDCERFEPILPFLKIFMLAPEKNTFVTAKTLLVKNRCKNLILQYLHCTFVLPIS